MGVAKEQKLAQRSTKVAANDRRKHGTEFRGWVDYPWDEASRQQCKDWQVTPDELWLDLSDMVVRGYTFRFVRDSRGGGFMCQCYGSDDEKGTAGLAMSGRGSTGPKALKALLYANERLGGVWTQLEGSNLGNGAYDD